MPGGPDVLFVGRLIPEKGGSTLLRAMAEAPLKASNTSCWIVGDGPELDNLKQMSSQLGLGSRVKFKAWMKEEEIYGAMKSAKVVVLPSRREGFGMVVLEAMACGTPVVVTLGENSAAPDLVQSGKTGLVVPNDPRPLSHAIASIVSSPQLRTTMGSNAQEFARGYDWELIANQAETVYLKAIESGSREKRYVPNK